MSVKEPLMAGDREAALGGLEDTDASQVLDELLYVACHTEDREALVLMDSVREALDYFPDGDKTLLSRCVAYLDSQDREEWTFPESVRYQGDPLSSYIRALRVREPERAGYLAREVIKKVGLDTLGKTWVKLSMEKVGDNGENFVAGSSARRCLNFSGPGTREYVTYWTSRFLSQRVYSSRKEATGLADYADLAYDQELMERVCRHPGDGLGNIVYLHRLKQNMNVLGNHPLGALMDEMERMVEESEERYVETEREGRATKKGFREALEREDREEALSHLAGLHRKHLDFVCRQLLEFAAGSGVEEDAHPFIAAHAACEISRTMSTEPGLPLAQALDYLMDVRENEGSI